MTVFRNCPIRRAVRQKMEMCGNMIDDSGISM